MKLDEAIEKFLTYRKGVGYERNTVRQEESVLGKFLAVIGNIQTGNLGPQHGERFNTWLLEQGYAPRSVNIYMGALRRFLGWCSTHRYVSRDVLGTTRPAKVIEPPRRRLPARDFPRLLDACTHPQQRIVVALGLYLFLRASEVRSLRIRDVRLDDAEIDVFQPKTKRWDTMPIFKPLDAELRRWLTWLAEDQQQPLHPDWFLVASRRRPRLESLPGGKRRSVPRETNSVDPLRPTAHPQRAVQRALQGIGWDTEGQREGCHTLRRSGARALFDDEVEAGEVRDGILRDIQSMLHHRSSSQTEHYLGVEADIQRRNTRFKGREMFHRTESDNVVALHAKEG